MYRRGAPAAARRARSTSASLCRPAASPAPAPPAPSTSWRNSAQRSAGLGAAAASGDEMSSPWDASRRRSIRSMPGGFAGHAANGRRDAAGRSAPVDDACLLGEPMLPARRAARSAPARRTPHTSPRPTRAAPPAPMALGQAENAAPWPAARTQSPPSESHTHEHTHPHSTPQACHFATLPTLPPSHPARAGAPTWRAVIRTLPPTLPPQARDCGD